MSKTETNAGEPAPPLAVGAPKRGLTVGVAAVIAAVLDTPGTVGVTFDVNSGDVAIAEAIRALASPA